MTRLTEEDESWESRETPHRAVRHALAPCDIPRSEPAHAPAFGQLEGARDELDTHIGDPAVSRPKRCEMGTPLEVHDRVVVDSLSLAVEEQRGEEGCSRSYGREEFGQDDERMFLLLEVLVWRELRQSNDHR